jgi:hypothetical protein
VRHAADFCNRSKDVIDSIDSCANDGVLDDRLVYSPKGFQREKLKGVRPSILRFSAASR